MAAREFLEAAALGSQPQGILTADLEAGRQSIARRIPVGVIGIITPWNSPFILDARAIGPALAMGNAVILKPDVQTPVAGGVTFARLQIVRYHECLGARNSPEWRAPLIRVLKNGHFSRESDGFLKGVGFQRLAAILSPLNLVSWSPICVPQKALRRAGFVFRNFRLLLVRLRPGSSVLGERKRQRNTTPCIAS